MRAWEQGFLAWKSALSCHGNPRHHHFATMQFNSLTAHMMLVDMLQESLDVLSSNLELPGLFKAGTAWPPVPLESGACGNVKTAAPNAGPCAAPPASLCMQATGCAGLAQTRPRTGGG